MKLFLSTISASHRKRGPEMFRAIIHMAASRTPLRACCLFWNSAAGLPKAQAGHGQFTS
jgi:hypothetical protein